MEEEKDVQEDPILELGCKCSADRGSGLALAHRSCAVTWFGAKRVRSSVAYEQLTCEVCK